MHTVEEVKREEKWFKTHHLKDDLKAHTVKGGFTTIAGQAISFIMTLSSTAIMARLLSPEDYGLVAMVTAVTGFVTIFKDLGLSAAIIQRDNVEHYQVSAVFWINVAISLGIASLIAVLAPVLVSFYNESRLLNITFAFAFSIFFAGLSLQHNALMKRQMKFSSLSVIQIGSTGLSLLTGIILAYIGFGYWAIVMATVLNPVLSTIAVWTVCDWRPAFVFKASEASSFLKFGAGIAGFDLINYFSRNLDNVLIGKFVGSAALGLYSKAYQLLMLPITQLRDPLNTVALPAMSTIQKEKHKFKGFYQRYIFTLSFFSMPLVVYLAIFSEELVLIVLGDQWTEAAFIFKLLAITAFIQPVASTRGIVLIAAGKTKKYFIWGVANAVFVITGFLIGVQWGVTGVAVAYAIVNYLLLLPSLYYCFHNSPITVGIFFREIAFPMLFSLASGAVILAFKLQFSHLSGFILFPLGFILGAVFYLAPWFLSKQSKQRLDQLTDLKEMVRSKIFKKSDN
ncbi:MAG: lipopolysaccharide biosynthesis protein [Hymenobacteraceae bacterium]|nr:lipopolysaccharide biosynthesis protein [Hymenobacteraceae bacterium]